MSSRSLKYLSSISWLQNTSSKLFKSSWYFTNIIICPVNLIQCDVVRESVLVASLYFTYLQLILYISIISLPVCNGQFQITWYFYCVTIYYTDSVDLETVTHHLAKGFNFWEQVTTSVRPASALVRGGCVVGRCTVLSVSVAHTCSCATRDNSSVICTHIKVITINYIFIRLNIYINNCLRY